MKKHLFRLMALAALLMAPMAAQGQTDDCSDYADVPYATGFEDLQTGQLPACWLQISTNTGAVATVFPSAYNYAPNARNSNVYFEFESTNGATVEEVALPRMENISDLKFIFYASAQAAYGCLLEVGVLEDSVFVPVDTVELVYTYNWGTGYRPYAVFFDSYTGTGDRIAIRVKGTGSGQYTLMMDDLSVTVANAPEVSLPASGTTDVDTDYTIAATCNVASATYSWTSSMESAGQATMTYTDSVLTINYLAGGTDTVRVTAGNIWGSSVATMLVNVRDCSPRTVLPWGEDFSQATALDCWTILDLDNYTNSNWYRSPDGYVRTGYNPSSAANDWLITPAVVLPADGEDLSLTYDAYGSWYSTNTTPLSVLVSRGASLDTAGFTDTLSSLDLPSNVWTHYGYSLNDYLGETIRIAFVYSGHDDNGARIDNVSVRSALVPMLNPITGPATADVNVAATYATSLQEGSSSNLFYTWSSVMETAGDASLSYSDDSVEVVYYTIGTDTLMVVAENDYGSDTAYYIVRVRDLAPVEVFPYSASFEEDEDDADYWQTVSSSGNAWVIDTAAHAGTGSRALYISNDGGAHNAYSIATTTYAYAYRALNITQAGEYSISYDWRSNGELGSYNSYDFLRVFLAPGTTEIGTTSLPRLTFNSLPDDCLAADGGSCLGSQTSWQHEDQVVNVPTEGVWLLVFYWRNDMSDGDNPPAAIDNVAIQPLTCSSPTGLTLDNATETTLELSWTPRGSEGSWEVTVNGVSTEVYSSDYTATGLSTATEYEVRVRAICGAGDTSTALVGNYRTACGINTLPWREDFTTAGTLDCWTLLDLDGNSYGWRHDSDGVLESSTPYYGATDNCAISPAVDIPAAADAVTMSWDVMADGWDATPTYYVLVNPTGTTALADFTDTVFTESYDGDFVSRSVDLSSYAGNTIRVAFRHQGSGHCTLDLDNLHIRESNLPSVSLVAPRAAITGDTVMVEAVLLEGARAGLTYTWTSLMATAGDATLALDDSVATLIYTAGGIDTVTVVVANTYGADTARVAIVVQQCDLVTTLPYTVDFEVDNACWTTADHNADGHTWFYSDQIMTTSSVDAHSGTRFLACESYDLNGYDNITPDDWFISPAIQLPADSATLSWYHMAGYTPDYNEHYAVYVSTAGGTVSDFLATTPVFETTLGYDDYMVWNQQTVNLEDYLGQTIRIAFRHFNCSGQYYLGIDDISITHTNGTTSPSDTTSPVPTYIVSVAAEDPSMGSVSPAGTHTVYAGDSFTATATPYDGYRFFGWRGASAVTVVENPLTVTVNSDMTLEAVFVPVGSEPATYTVTVNYDRNRGTVLGDGTYSEGTQVTLTATPFDGYRFAGWSNGQTDSIITFTLTEDVTLTANFAEVVGIDDVQVSPITLHPNPATTTVTLGGLQAAAQVEVVDINGRIHSAFKTQSSAFKMDISGLPRGTYFVRITGEAATAVIKLIVQ